MAVKVCLVTSGHLSTNPRLVKEAEALERAGYDVRIVAARFLPWADAEDQVFLARGWKVRRIPFGPAATPIMRIARSLRRRLARRAAKLFGFPLWLVRLACHWIVPELTKHARGCGADIYVAHNLAALPAAVAAAASAKAKAVFDAEDFHSGEPTEGVAGDYDRRLAEALESHYMPLCDAITAASPGIARAYAMRYGIREPTVVLNTFPLAMAHGGGCSRESPPRRPSVYWFSQTIGPMRGLECAIRSIAKSRSRPHLYLRGSASEDYRRELTALAQAHGVAERLHFLPPAAPEEMVRLAAMYDVGFAGEPGHSPNNRICLSNKLFCYLLAGIPVLASATPAQTAFASEAPEAVRLYRPDQESELAAQIDRLFGDVAELDMARSAAKRAGAERYNWDVEQVRWLREIESVLGGCSSAAEPVD